jgi:predicted nucleic acid-binding protein
MSASLVIDCSVTMAWCFGDEATAKTVAVQNRLVSETAIVPAHWSLEVANVLAMAERRQRITATDAAEFLRLLGLLDIERDDQTPQRAFGEILALARSHNLTVYDAAYLELAQRLQLPLASLDVPLCQAADGLGIELLIA